MTVRNDFLIQIPDYIYKDIGLYPVEIITYCFLQMMFAGHYKFTDTAYYSVETILSNMYGKREFTRYEKQSIEKAVAGLIEQGVLRENNGGINPECFKKTPGERCTHIHIKMLQRILQSDVAKKMELCVYLMWLVSTRNIGTGEICQKEEYLAKSVGISVRTVRRYNATLEGLGIIVIKRSKVSYDEAGKYYYRKNNQYYLANGE